MEINDKEYQCWHEVGHAIACMESGGEVVSIELASNSNLPYLAKASCKTPTSDMRIHTSAGGFAIEYALLQFGRIIIPEKDFLYEAIENSSQDRSKFRGDENISDEECLRFFIEYAMELSNDFLPRINKFEKVVNQLIENGKLSGNEIEEIYNS